MKLKLALFLARAAPGRFASVFFLLCTIGLKFAGPPQRSGPIKVG